MKQIRRGVFETNSSSTHTMAIMSQSEYDEWNKKIKSGDYYTDPEYNLYSKEQVKEEYEKDCKKRKEKGWPISTFEEWRDYEYFTEKEFDTYTESYQGIFEKKKIGSEDVIVMGYYGYDG